MKIPEKLTVQYITDESGEKRAVIVPIEQYHALLEDLEDLAVMAERREEPAMSHEDVLAALKRDGFLPD